MKRAPHITCLGEGFVDFISTKNGVSLSAAPGFAKRAGGACANVAAGVAKLGVGSAFAGNVGDDSFGHFLRNELAKAGVDVAGIRFDRMHKTRLAFVSLAKSGERDFEFRGHHPADEHLNLRNVQINKLARSAIVHIGSFLLLREPSRSTAMRVAAALIQKKCMISFDPNLRLSLWNSRSEARRLNLAMAAQATILRLNQEEALFLAGRKNIDSAVRELSALGPSIVVATMGKEGCYVRTGKGSTYVKGFKVRSIDTTGCGDAFFAAFLAAIAKNPSTPIPLELLYSMCRYANAAGALTATKLGAMAAMPTARQVDKFLSMNP